jgi:hypothetical protein
MAKITEKEILEICGEEPLKYELDKIKRALQKKMEYIFEYDKYMIAKMDIHINQEYHRVLKVVDWDLKSKREFYFSINRYSWTIPVEEQPFYEIIATTFRKLAFKTK